MRYLCYDTCGSSSTLPPPPASLNGTTCSDSCTHSSNGECDDGGPGSEFAWCAPGSDCSDCGDRGSSPPPPKGAPRLPPPPLLPFPPPALPPPAPTPGDNSTVVTCHSAFASDTSYETCRPWCISLAQSTSNCARCECATCSGCSPSRPPPALPPLPPATILIESREPELHLTVAGTDGDYTAERLLILRKYLAEQLGVDLADVSVTISSTNGRRRQRRLSTSTALVFRVAAQANDASTQKVMDELGSLQDIASASIALRVPVIDSPSITVHVTHRVVVRPPATPPIPPMLPPPPSPPLSQPSPLPPPSPLSPPSPSPPPLPTLTPSPSPPLPSPPTPPSHSGTPSPPSLSVPTTCEVQHMGRSCTCRYIWAEDDEPTGTHLVCEGE